MHDLAEFDAQMIQSRFGVLLVTVHIKRYRHVNVSAPRKRQVRQNKSALPVDMRPHYASVQRGLFPENGPESLPRLFGVPPPRESAGSDSNLTANRTAPGEGLGPKLTGNIGPKHLCPFATCHTFSTVSAFASEKPKHQAKPTTSWHIQTFSHNL